MSPLGRWTGAVLAAGWLAATLSVQAGVAITTSGRHDGQLALAAGALRAGDRALPWDEVLLAVNDIQAETPVAPERVHFRDGGSLSATARLAGGKLVLESPLLGAIEVDPARVSAIDFSAAAESAPGRAEGVMERRSAGPLPCELIWIRGDRVGIRSVVGAAALEKRDLVRYLFPAPDEDAAPAPAAGGDEVTLVDGSVLRGGVRVEEGGLVVQTTALGEVKVPHAAWQSLWRGGSTNCALLALLEPREVRRFPLVRRLADGPAAVRARPGAAEGFVQRVVFRPRSIVVYDVPGQAGETYLFNAGLALLDGSRGGARVTITVGDKVLLDRTLAPAAPAEPVSLEAPAGGTLAIEVDFAEQVRLPCGVAFDDAMLLRKQAP